MEMTVETQKQGLAKLGVTDQRIAELKSKFGNMPAVAVGDTAGYKQLTSAIAEVRDDRVAVERRRKELVENAVKWQKLVNTEASRIKAELESIEEPLKANKKIIDDEKDRIREAAAQAERDRIKRIQDGIENFRSFLIEAATSDSQGIRQLIIDLERCDILKDRFQEFYDQALSVYQESLTKLNEMLAAKVNAEEVAKQQEAERVRLAEEQSRIAEQQRVEAEKLAAERKAFEDQQRAEQQRQAAIQAEIERQQAEERAKLKAEQDALDAAKREHEAKLKAEQDEKDRIAREAKQAEEKAAAEAERVRKIEELRQADLALQPDRAVIKGFLETTGGFVQTVSLETRSKLRNETMIAEFDVIVSAIKKTINQFGG